MAVGWIATQALWLFLAFQLEFEGKNRYYELFAVGAVLFVMHLWMLIQFMKWRIPCTSDDISERSWNNGSRNKILSKKDE